MDGADDDDHGSLVNAFYELGWLRFPVRDTLDIPFRLFSRNAFLGAFQRRSFSYRSMEHGAFLSSSGSCIGSIWFEFYLGVVGSEHPGNTVICIYPGATRRSQGLEVFKKNFFSLLLHHAFLQMSDVYVNLQKG